MSTVGHWCALSATYLTVHFLFIFLGEGGMMETPLARQYGPHILVSLLFGIRHVLLAFLSAIATTLVGRWWFHTSALSTILVLTAICPFLFLISLLRYVGESGLVVSFSECLITFGIALLAAYLAIGLGLRLQLA